MPVSNALAVVPSSTQCIVTVDHISEGNILNTNKTHIYQPSTFNDKLKITFDLTKIDVSYWHDNFSDASPTNGVPDVFDNGDVWINFSLNEILSDIQCSSSDFPIPNIVQTIIHGETLYNKTCSGSQLIHEPYVVALRYKDSDGNYNSICELEVSVDDKTFQVANEPPASVDISVISVDGKSDINTEWLVTIKDLILPPSIYTRFMVLALYYDNIDLVQSTLGDHINEDFHSEFFDYFIRPTRLSPLGSYEPLIRQTGSSIGYNFVLKKRAPGLHSIKLVAYYPFSSGITIGEHAFEVVEKDQPTPTVLPTLRPGETPTATPYLELKNVCENIQGDLANPGEKEDCEACLLGGGAFTALGCMPTNLSDFLQKYVFTLGLGMAGGIAFLLMLWGGFLVLSSQGDAQQIGLGREIIIGAVTGLLFIIFSIFILRFIGVDILRIPGFGPKPADPVINECVETGGYCTTAVKCTAANGNSLPLPGCGNPGETCCIEVSTVSAPVTPEPTIFYNPLSGPTETPTPTSSRPGGLMPAQDTIQPADLATAMETRSGGGLKDTVITFNPGRINMTGSIEISAGMWQNFEATVRMRIESNSFRIDAQSIYIGGNDVSANQQAQAKIEEVVQLSLNNDLLPQRFLDSYQIVNGNLVVDSQKRR